MRCSNWSQSSISAGGGAFTTPLFQRTEDGRLVYVGGRYVPKFETVTEGFTSLKMITRSDGSPVASSSNKTPTHPYLWDSATLTQMEGKICDDDPGINFHYLVTIEITNCAVTYRRGRSYDPQRGRIISSAA